MEEKTLGFRLPKLVYLQDKSLGDMCWLSLYNYQGFMSSITGSENHELQGAEKSRSSITRRNPIRNNNWMAYESPQPLNFTNGYYKNNTKNSPIILI